MKCNEMKMSDRNVRIERPKKHHLDSRPTPITCWMHKGNHGHSGICLGMGKPNQIQHKLCTRGIGLAHDQPMVQSNNPWSIWPHSGLGLIKQNGLAHSNPAWAPHRVTNASTVTPPIILLIIVNIITLTIMKGEGARRAGVVGKNWCDLWVMTAEKEREEFRRIRGNLTRKHEWKVIRLQR